MITKSAKNLSINLINISKSIANGKFPMVASQHTTAVQQASMLNGTYIDAVQAAGGIRFAAAQSIEIRLVF